MRLKLISFLLLMTIAASGQRIVNKIYFIFPSQTTIDTIGTKFPYKFIMTVDSGLRLSNLPQEKGPRIPSKAKGFFKPTLSDVRLADSLIKTNLLQIIISGDSLLYVRNELYKWYNQQPSDFYKYKATKQEAYKKATSIDKKKIKHSDRYYLGYINQQGDKRLIIFFDPKKIRYRLLGDIRDVDYCEPMVLDIENRKITFAYFPYPDFE